MRCFKLRHTNLLAETEIDNLGGLSIYKVHTALGCSIFITNMCQRDGERETCFAT